MSIEISTLVWDHSAHSSTPLTAMLALADMANHDGHCWPSVDSLAKRCRCSERQMQRIIAELEESGELFVERGVGRKNVSRYLLTLNTTVDQLSSRLVHYFGCTPAQAIEAATRHIKKGDKSGEKVTQMSPKQNAQKGDILGEKVTLGTPFQTQEKGDKSGEKVTSGAEKVTSSAGKGDIAMSPDPSLIHHDPSVKDATRASDPPNEPPPQPSPPTALAAPAAEADYQAVRRVYENEIGLLTPIISDSIKEQLRQCPSAWLTLAIGIAVKRNNRRWSYVEGILRRWQVEGFDGGQDNLSAGADRKGTGSKSAGYGRPQQRGGTSPRKGKQDIDPEFLATFTDARDGTAAIAAD